MPNCRHCGSRLSRFDKDMCPVCGCKHPFDGVSQETCDVTQEINALDKEEINFRRFSRKKVLALSLTLGFLGAPYFYMKYKLLGIVHFLANTALATLILLCLLFFSNLQAWVSVLIVLGVLLFLNIVLGVSLFLKRDLRDGRGEYLD